MPLVVAAGCASAAPGSVAALRAADAEFVKKAAPALSAKHGTKYIVVANGGVAAVASLPDDAVRAAADSPHRFIFRAADGGPRMYRTTYLPVGGAAVGRKVFENLGYHVTGGGGRPLVLVSGGTRRVIDPATAPRLSIAVSTLDGTVSRTLEFPVDPDFDGGLLLTTLLGDEFQTAQSEVPGDAEVQVALGRPFEARRALLLVRIASLGVSGVVEALVPTK